MLILPDEIMALLTPFKQLFSRRIWDLVQVLVVGALLAPGKRTVSAVLEVMGLKEERQFQNYHRVLNRAKWSSLAVSRVLLGLLVAAFVPAGETVVVGADETLERRWGPQVKAKSIFRDGKRSSHGYSHYTPALRWLGLMVLAGVPWSRRVWGLPFLTLLAPSRTTNEANGRRHKSSIDWLGQSVAALRRWLPGRAITLVTDGGLSGVKLGWHCRRYGVTFISRLRLDAALHAPTTRQGAKKGRRLPSLKQRLTDPATCWQRCQVGWYQQETRLLDLATGTALWATPHRDPLPIRWLLVRDPLGRLPPSAFLSTDLSLTPAAILTTYIRRWSVEVTFQEVRTHLGVETQRQWSDLAILRTTPALLGLFSLVTLLAQRLTRDAPFPKRHTAWYHKPEPTFSDALALVRRYLWSNLQTVESRPTTRLITSPNRWLHGLLDATCYST